MGRTGRMQLGAGAKARVHQTPVLQLPEAGSVDLRALALVIGAVRPAGAAALVPDKAQPVEVLLQQVGVDSRAALGVQILNAQHDASAPASGTEPRQQAAGQIAQMQPTAGAGCKPAGWRYYLRFITMCLVLHWGSFQPLDDLKLPTRSLWQYQRKYYFIYSRL